MKATMLLRRDHRNIEQALALIGSIWDVTDDDFHALAADLMAHLAADESLLYPAAERAMVDDLAAHRVRHARLRTAVIQATGRTGDRTVFRQRLSDLADAFATHARLEERTVHPSLESALNEASLEALGTKVATFRASMMTGACAAALVHA